MFHYIALHYFLTYSVPGGCDKRLYVENNNIVATNFEASQPFNCDEIHCFFKK